MYFGLNIVITGNKNFKEEKFVTFEDKICPGRRIGSQEADCTCLVYTKILRRALHSESMTLEYEYLLVFPNG